jgi:hypothetical protein
MTTAEQLRAAAVRVRLGWCQGALKQGERVCAIGALGLSIAPPGATAVTILSLMPASCALLRAIGHGWKDALDAPLHVTAWNDTPGRTAEEVATALECAADLWDAEQQPAAMELIPA